MAGFFILVLQRLQTRVIASLQRDEESPDSIEQLTGE